MRLGALVLLAATAVTGCDSDATTAPSAAPCSPDAIWDRNLQARDPADDALDAEITGGTGATAEEAIHALALGRGLEISVVASRPVDTAEHPDDDLDVDVIDDRGRTGTYHLADKAGLWVVSGGDGCGAPPPVELDRDRTPCAVPSVPPDMKPGDHVYVGC